MKFEQVYESYMKQLKMVRESDSTVSGNDEEYLAVVDRWDMKEAQRMVDAAAKSAGIKKKNLVFTLTSSMSYNDLNKLDERIARAVDEMADCYWEDVGEKEEYGNDRDAYLQIEYGKRFVTAGGDSYELDSTDKYTGGRAYQIFEKHNGVRKQLTTELDDLEGKIPRDPVLYDREGKIIPLSQRFGRK